MKNNKSVGIFIIGLIYLLTTILGGLIYFVLPESIKTEPLFPLFIVDVICTIIIYIFSRIFNNSSIYDPYWSVAPVVIYAGFILITGYSNIYITIFLLIVILWSMRLTSNWAINFRNLSVQDWRYQNFKDKHPKTYFLIDLFGIHLVPTIVVFAGMIPGFFFIEKAYTTPLQGTVLIGFILMLVGIIISLIADAQMIKFRKTNRIQGKIMDSGLWKYSRHPNYFGEILFWISIWLVFYATKPNITVGLITACCPIAIFMLFIFISIPMMEKRQIKNKVGYKEYIERTNMLLVYPLLKNKK